MSKKVLVTGTSVAPKFLEPLQRAGFEVKNPVHLLTEHELQMELSGSSAYLMGGDEYVTANSLNDAKRLRIIAFLGVGYESFIDVKAATEHGIAVTNTPGTLTDSVAELTVGQLLNARRRLAQYCNAFRRGEHGAEEKQYDLAGHTVGIVGLGAIGTRIAEILTVGFHATVNYYSRTRKPLEEDRLGISMLPLKDLASVSESLVLMVPGNSSTHHMIDHGVIAALPTGALLINTARPEIVDPVALRQGLNSGTVSVAAYDNFYDGEVGQQLMHDFGDDKLLVTGHIGSLTHDARDGMARKAVQSIISYTETGTDEYVVNKLL